MDFHDQTRFGYQEPDEPDPPCTIEPIIAEDGSGIVGFAAYAEGGEQVTEVRSTRREAADAAEASGYDPWMTDEELDDENEALDHGTWPF